MIFKMKAIRFVSSSMTAAFVLGTGFLPVQAAPLAGVSSYTASATEATETTTTTATTALAMNLNATTFGGVTAMISSIVLEAEQTVAAAEEAEQEIIAESEQIEAAANENEYANIGIAQVTDYVYIRSEASAESEYVGKLYADAAATVNGEDGDWYLITSGDVTGYINKEYLIVGDEQLIKDSSRRVATVMTETLYVRSEATTESSIMGMVPLTDDLTVTDESILDTGWVKVLVPEGEGYVSAEFVTLWTEYTLAESKEAEEARLAKEEADRQAARSAAEAAVASSNASTASSNAAYTASYAAPTGSNGAAVVNYAAQFLGNPYVYGGSSLTNGTDCSGFVMSVYRAFGVSLPHSSAAQRSVGYGVSDMQPGDIVCYSGHVGIYAGNGMIINASTPSTGIIYTNVYYDRILAVRRIF